MSLKTTLRLPLLAVNFAVAGFVLGNIFFDSKIGQLTPFPFPQSVPLSDWQAVDSKRLKAIPKSDDDYGSTFLVGRQYQYIQNNRPLEIQMRYVIKTKGEVDKFIREQASMEKSGTGELSGKIAHESGIGDYGLLSDSQNAYLSACINPRGRSSLTMEQYKHNQDIYDAQLGRILPWLFDRQKWRDDRCLWTHMSVSLQGSAPEETYKVLEEAWFEWYEWWQPRFPEL